MKHQSILTTPNSNLSLFNIIIKLQKVYNNGCKQITSLMLLIFQEKA